VRRYIERNFRPEQLYGDVRDRPARCAEPLDLYVAGPPCTSASRLNRNQPEAEQDEAYDVCRLCFALIAESRPHCFVVENVVQMRRVRGGLFPALPY
jgi:site-specific DNA-cytosine methylase